MLAPLLAAALAIGPGAADVATIPVDEGGEVRPGAELAGLPDAELERRIADLRRKNQRSFSDRRSLQIQALKAEQERRRHERSWDEEDRARRAREAEATARAEAEFQAAEARSREADEVAARTLAVVRARAEEEARVEAELKARERRDAVVRWVALGALAAAGAAAGLVYARRRRG